MPCSRCLWCCSWLGMCSAVLAQPYDPPAAPAIEAAAPLLLHLPSNGAGVSLRALRLGAMAAEPTPASWGLSVIELPADSLPGLAPQRRHHALRFGLDAPRVWLRSLGLDARECAGQLRAPSRLRAGSRGDGASFEAQLQLRLQCQY
jgi:hypothetical protein